MNLRAMSNKELYDINGGVISVAFISLCVAVFGLAYKVGKEW